MAVESWFSKLFELLPVVAVAVVAADVLAAVEDWVAPLLLAADRLSNKAMSCHGLEFKLPTLLIPDTTSTPFIEDP
jgi:hypothetical protein